ncbi:MAG: sugar phosphate isomerase/epimerase [Acidobacteria bacterium]|nr:sugar phosphate isomerase/epimerase [Acidobacteriota bacterium]
MGRKSFTRRDFIRLVSNGAALGAVAQATLLDPGALWAAPPAAINSTFRGVLIGAQSYSFRDRPLDEAISGYVETGIGSAELWQGHMERVNGQRREGGREGIRKWRMTVSLDEFAAAGKKFRDAGVDVYAYNYSFRDDFTDGEMERGFEMAKALGAKVITASSNVSTAMRVDPFAKKHQMRVGMHNHSRIRENEFATPDDFDKARRGASEYIAVNLDIGHFVAAGFDPVPFIEKNNADIVTLHLKDRKKNQGENLPFGQGDTPVKEVLALLRDSKYAIPANIEYEYDGADTLEEMKKCLAYCKQALMA